MNIFLTGATGFIGSRLAMRLVAEGHEVALLVRPGSDRTPITECANRLAVHVYDGTLASLVGALEEERPEVVVHVASLFLAQHRPEDVECLVASNIDMPSKLLEAMRLAGVRSFVNTGTSWQHYRSATYDPVNFYAATKQAFEEILTYYVEAHEFQAVTLKLFDTYGPGDTRPKLFSLLRRTALSGGVLRMSPGEQLIDLVYIDDVTDAFVGALNLVGTVDRHATFAVSNPERCTLRELVRIYGEIVGRTLDIDWGALPYRPRETLVPWTTGRRLDGWMPRVSLEEGIRRMEQAVGTLV
jgi:nucleoside-diphosphate-sugar epimerase